MSRFPIVRRLEHFAAKWTPARRQQCDHARTSRADYDPVGSVSALVQQAWPVALLGAALGMALPAPATAQTAVGCAPFCDYRHYYGTYDYTWAAPATYCQPVCGPDGTCVPVKTCVRAPFAAHAPSIVSFYVPGLANPGAVPTRAVRTTPTVRVRTYRARR